MNNLIQSLPSPSAYSGGITHTWMGETWMVDGEASVLMMAMISSNSPSRQGARTEFLNPEKGFAMAAALRTTFWKTIEPPLFLGQGLCVVERGIRGGARGGLTMPRRGPTLAAPGGGEGTPLPLSDSASGSGVLRVSYGLFLRFRVFS